MAEINETLLDERLAVLEKAHAWGPRVVSKLESLFRSEDEEAVFRINPIGFATSRGLAENEVIDLFLHATSAGLVDMDWLLLCPACSCVVESFRSLTGVRNHYHCRLCQTDYDTALDDLIAIAFTINREIRDIRFNHPERLSPEELLFTYGGTRDGILPDGTPLVDAQRSVTRVAFHLPGEESREFEVEASEGKLFGASMDGRLAFYFPIEGPAKADVQNFNVELLGERSKHLARKVSPGRFRFTIRNTGGERCTGLIAVLPPAFEFGHPVEFVPFLDGKRLLTNQVFRELFHHEVIRANEGIGVRDIALLFTDLKGSTALYDRIGDLNAFALVHQHFDLLQSVTVRHGGAVIKTIGDAVMAAFLNPVDALNAAIAMRQDIEVFNHGRTDRQLILKIGIHKGPAIAVTLNGRLDYFGQTVNIAARIQNLADAGEIYISEHVFDADGMTETVGALAPQSKLTALRGIDEEMRVYLIASSSVPGTQGR